MPKPQRPALRATGGFGPLAVATAASDAAALAGLVEQLRAAEPSAARDALSAAPLPIAIAAIGQLTQGADESVVAKLAAVAENAAPPLALTAIESLGTLTSPGAATALLQLADGATDKDRRKAARRGLAHLRSRGIHPTTEPVAVLRTIAVDDTAVAYRAVATHIDGTGSRLVWLFVERRLGGAYLASALLSFEAGMKDFSIDETTRRKLAAREAAVRDRSEGAPWIELPVHYARWLFHEAARLNAESGTPIPTEYYIWRDRLPPVDPSIERPLIYETVSRFEAKMRPDLVRESPRLLEEPELYGWLLPPTVVRPYAAELRRARESRLVLSTESEEQREERVAGQLIREHYTERRRHALVRSLEETAYLFLCTERPTQARLAVAAAVEVADSDLVLLPRNPFVRALVLRSIEFTLHLERGGSESPLTQRRSPLLLD